MFMNQGIIFRTRINERGNQDNNNNSDWSGMKYTETTE